MLSQWQNVPDSKILLDYWLIGGTLTVTAVTTTLNSLGQMVYDRENQTVRDFSITPLSFKQIQLSYICSSAIIGLFMQLLVWLILEIYFVISDGVVFQLVLLPKLILIAFISSLVWTVINNFIINGISTSKTMGMVNSIMGTIAGFFAGVYIPIGTTPEIAQKIMKMTPAPYNAAIYRDVLMNSQMKSTFKNSPTTVQTNFENLMGIKVTLGKPLTLIMESYIMLGMALLVLLLLLLESKKIRKAILKRG
ncbi:ABC transporter permease [Fructilactobacillus vespulae]|uniref:ABC transporter permease n=1 Tax=Fructilactobacillus vespulae TaxID=1249630 RepID=UPI0039B6D71E